LLRVTDVGAYDPVEWESMIVWVFLNPDAVFFSFDSKDASDGILNLKYSRIECARGKRW
jgi:hypothetical protein